MTSFDRIVVLDFEATCEPGGAPSPQEVIEFPSVLVSLADRAVEDTFSTFVRPIHHPRLSEFCKDLTSIRQEDIDAAPTFPEVLAAHRAWLEGHGLFDSDGRERFAFVTCGDWDLATMLPVQCAAAGIDIGRLPRAYRRWINIKKIFLATLGKPKSLGMPTMLSALGLQLEGTHHRGIDDCHNIARIALALRDRGATFEITSHLPPSHYPELPLELQCGDQRAQVVLKKRALPSLLGLASGAFRMAID
ncbi:MAG TPA: 3'-5' exonuclease, partial [Nannocystis sp.]